MPKNIKADVRELTEKLMQDFLLHAPGVRLPSYRKLLTQYGCSRQTLNRVLERLKQRNLIRTEDRSGMFVNENNTSTEKRILFLRVDWPCDHADMFSQKIRAEFKKRNLGCYSELRYDQEKLPSVLNGLDRYAADVYILWLEKCDREKIEILRKLGKRIIFFDCGLELYDADILDPGETMFGMYAAKYLLEKGHTKTAMIVTEPLSLTCKKKIDGFMNYMQTNGVEPELIICPLKNGEGSAAQAEEYLLDHFRKNPPEFTGCFSSGPLPKVLEDLGLKISTVVGSGCPESSPKIPDAFVVFDVEKSVQALADGLEAIFRGERFGYRSVQPKLIKNLQQKRRTEKCYNKQTTERNQTK